MFLRPTVTVRLAALALLSTVGGFAQYTEYPQTVAPGRFRLEMDALSLVIDREGSDELTAIGAASTFLTTGLTEAWDIQLGAQLFLSQRIDRNGLRERNSGVGDVFVRTKWRFLDDPSTGLTAALMPYLKIPTSSGRVGNDSIEGGVIVPWQWQLPGDFRARAMAQLDFRRNTDDDGFDTFWFASAMLTRPVTRGVDVYAEIDAGKSSGGAPWAGRMGAGATLHLSTQTFWDFAVYRGISSGAADWNPVVRFNFDF